MAKFYDVFSLLERNSFAYFQVLYVVLYNKKFSLISFVMELISHDMTRFLSAFQVWELLIFGARLDGFFNEVLFFLI